MSKPTDRLKGAREAMQKFAGARQRAPGFPPGETVSTPSPRSTVSGAMASGIERLDPNAYELGLADGQLHDFWRIGPDDVLSKEFDTLAYAKGWIEGARRRAKQREN